MLAKWVLFIVCALPLLPAQVLSQVQRSVMDSGGGELEICVQDFKNIHLSDRLLKLTSYFDAGAITKYVNETQGSFIEIDTATVPMTIRFTTSGLLDLTIIHREGNLQFCDDGEKLLVKALGRKDSITLKNSSIVFGSGGGRLSFRRGDKPKQLRQLAGEE
jgi:hypothetical protein